MPRSGSYSWKGVMPMFPYGRLHKTPLNGVGFRAKHPPSTMNKTLGGGQRTAPAASGNSVGGDRFSRDANGRFV